MLHGKKIRNGYFALAFSGPKSRQDGYITPAFLGIPSAHHEEKIRSGPLAPAFSGAQTWAV